MDCSTLGLPVPHHLPEFAQIQVKDFAVLCHSVMANFLQPHGLYPTSLLCPWGFSRQGYWSGLPCPPPGDLPNPGIEDGCPALQVDSLPSEPPGKILLNSLIEEGSRRTLQSAQRKIQRTLPV